MKIDQTFYLNGGEDFSSRQKQVFSELDRLGSSQPENRYVEQSDEFRQRRRRGCSGRTETRRLSGQESLFRVAPQPPFKRRTAGDNLNFIPDFVKHPTKWKKYDLGDDVMSDKTNQAAAMSFLKEVEARRQNRVEGGGESSGFKVPRIAFNRHVKGDDSVKTADKIDPVDKPTFIDGKLTMPEYIVGSEKKKIRVPKKTGVVAAGTVVKLDHLEEEDDDE